MMIELPFIILDLQGLNVISEGWTLDKPPKAEIHNLNTQQQNSSSPAFEHTMEELLKKLVSNSSTTSHQTNNKQRCMKYNQKCQFFFKRCHFAM